MVHVSCSVAGILISHLFTNHSLLVAIHLQSAHKTHHCNFLLLASTVHCAVPLLAFRLAGYEPCLLHQTSLAFQQPPSFQQYKIMPPGRNTVQEPCLDSHLAGGLRTQAYDLVNTANARSS